MLSPTCFKLICLNSVLNPTIWTELDVKIQQGYEISVYFLTLRSIDKLLKNLFIEGVLFLGLL